MKKVSVLIVEDDTDLRRMFKLSLAMEGFHVVEAADGLDGLRRIDESPPDAVVLDLMMPRVNGFAVLQDLLAQAHTREIPVVVVTGSSATVVAANVACILRKPITPESLVRVVRSCIAKSGPVGA